MCARIRSHADWLMRDVKPHFGMRVLVLPLIDHGYYSQSNKYTFQNYAVTGLNNWHIYG
jgi:hypothetical protein